MSIQMNLRLDPYPWYAEMLKAPVAYNPQFGAYLMFRHNDVRKVLSDPHTFSSAVFDGFSEELAYDKQLPALDPPRHTQLLRSLRMSLRLGQWPILNRESAKLRRS